MAELLGGASLVSLDFVLLRTVLSPVSLSPVAVVIKCNL